MSTPTAIGRPALALGCSRLGSALTPLSRRECLALIDEALALGVRQFDTASIYGQGDSERFLGEALQGRRHDVCLSSKAGQLLTRKQALLAHLKPAVRWLAARRGGLRRRVSAQRAQGVPRCFDPDYIERSLIDSLRRLRTDYLDVFYLHSPVPEVLHDERLMARIENLRSRGLFKALGVSCDEPALAWKAARHAQVQLVQFDFLEQPDSIALLSELAARKKLAFLRGFTRGEPAGGLADRFATALRLPAVASLIVGTVNPQHLRQNVSAFDLATRAAAHQEALA